MGKRLGRTVSRWDGVVELDVQQIGVRDVIGVAQVAEETFWNNLVTVSQSSVRYVCFLVTFLTSLLCNIHSPFVPFTINLKPSIQR